MLALVLFFDRITECIELIVEVLQLSALLEPILPQALVEISLRYLDSVEVAPLCLLDLANSSSDWLGLLPNSGPLL